ncbi:MAG: Na/Pi cotransporter family protein [bacterium]|nr:Na/Pi cotransporter family protein [bacterium]
MDWTDILFKSFGGLGLFLMGMKIMSEGMQKSAGDRLRKTLNFLTSNRIMAIIVGFFVTAVIQSSSATTVMVVGFVNASLMNLTQAIGVVLGANIGTTVTGWIIAFKILKLSFPLISIGVLIRFFSKSEKWTYFGEILFGFGLLFLGMQTMKLGVAPLRDSQAFIDFFTKVNGDGVFPILLGVAVGAVTTFIVQSSSATTGIIIALASQGLINFEGAVALIMGENIGTTITAMLASIGGNYHAKRAAVAHTLFNVLGVILALILFIPFVKLVEGMVPGFSNLTIETAEQAAQYGMEIGTKPLISPHIAMAHTVFNIGNVLIFVGLVPFLAKLCRKIIPEPKDKGELRVFEFSHIDSNLIRTPALAIAETEKQITVMAQKVTKSALIVQDIITSEAPQKELCDKVLREEKIIDEYQQYITEFLVSLSARALSESDANHVGNFITLSHNLEKYADHLEHIALIVDKIERKKLILSEEARGHMIEIFKEISNFYIASFNALSEEVDPLAFMDKAQVTNRRLKKLIKDAKLDHFARLRKKVNKNEAAVHFVDLLNYLEGMRAQAYNIAEITTGTKYPMN